MSDTLFGLGRHAVWAVQVESTTQQALFISPSVEGAAALAKTADEALAHPAGSVSVARLLGDVQAVGDRVSYR